LEIFCALLAAESPVDLDGTMFGARDIVAATGSAELGLLGVAIFLNSLACLLTNQTNLIGRTGLAGVRL
jgi:hypothetical protein